MNIPAKPRAKRMIAVLDDVEPVRMMKFPCEGEGRASKKGSEAALE